MTRKESLAVLIAKVEAGDIEGAPFWKVWMPEDPQCGRWAFIAHRAANGSLDAAKSLHEAVLPGWSWTMDWTLSRYEGALPAMKAHCQIWWFHGGNRSKSYCGATTSNGTPARAWLLAILRALHAQEADT